MKSLIFFVFLLLAGCGTILPDKPTSTVETAAKTLVSDVGTADVGFVWVLPLVGALCIAAAVVLVILGLRKEAVIVSAGGASLIVFGTLTDYIFIHAGWAIVASFVLLLVMAFTALGFTIFRHFASKKEIKDDDETFALIAKSLPTNEFDSLLEKIECNQWKDFLKKLRG